jgi:hypothetical protein
VNTIRSSEEGWMGQFEGVRTILYVYKDGGVTIQAGSGAVVVTRHPKDGGSVTVSVATGQARPVTLAGVYRIDQNSRGTKFIASINGGDVVSVDVKDDYPDPTVGERFKDTFKITYDELKAFDPAS